MNPLNLTCGELIDIFNERYGKGQFHAAALYRSFYSHPKFEIDKLPEFFRSEELTRKVEKDLSIRLPKIIRQESQGEVTKFFFRLTDGLEIESVVVPMANHASLCVSSQAGCRMGCRFCQTGKMGLMRNLTTEEIVAQVYTLKVLMGLPLKNVVFMGMGEPLDNFDSLVQAIRVLEDQRGLNIAKRNITVSTVGLADNIEKLASLGWPQLKLAVSLNAPNDTLRDRLMPINQRVPLRRLKSALEKYPLARGNYLFFEYVLIKGENDHPGLVRQISNFFKGMRVRLNLIPYNPMMHSPYKAPSSKDVERFRQELIAEGIFVRLRRTKGDGIRAACGQLGSDSHQR